MKIDVDTVSPVQRKIRVELPAEVVSREFVRAYESVGRRARIKGFRPGKAPRSVLQGLYGDEVRGQVLARLVEGSLGEVFKERGLQVVSRPEVEANDLEEGKAFTFSAVVEIKPEIELKDYLGFELEKVKFSVDDAQVELALRRLQDGHAQLVPVEDRDVVEKGDVVLVDFLGSIDGKPFPGGKAENYPIEVGAGKALLEFEDAMIGLKKGGEHTISVPYPENHFNRELAGKAVVFSVTVREIKRKVLPPLDDEFAKDYGECSSLDELRRNIRARLEDELAQIQTRELKEQLLTRLVEGHPFGVPPAMVDRQIRYLIDRQRSRLAAQGPDPSGQRPSTEQMRKDLEPYAIRQVKATLLLEKIAALEKIEVSDRELQEKIDEMVRSSGAKETSVRELYRYAEAREDLHSQMLFDRTLDLLFQRAKVKVIEPPVDAQLKKS